ncbi:hypothetical protein H4W31_008506 [Plantactinospora soyae]|uniref:Uncharacterized protein n=1 Tax=Plantactinospora soyae TaxID=1544732 RepID=A0A927R4H8_9ACTN|nr:hypothetical protein [Plantactinospora soyae]
MTAAAAMSVEEERLRPLYARALRLRHVDPGGTLCFVFFEGTVALGLLLALAELVSWWGVLVLPATVAVMVKVNDVVAAAVVRSAARVPAQERERFRREIQPAVGRASVPRQTLTGPGLAAPATGAGSGAAAGTDAAVPASGTPDPDRRPLDRIDPAARPAGMSAAVWARLERGGRGGFRPDQDQRPRPTVDVPHRARRQDTDRIRTSDRVMPSGGDPASSGVPSRPSPTPVANRAAERTNAGAAGRANAGAAERASAAERAGPAERAGAADRANAGAADRASAAERAGAGEWANAGAAERTTAGDAGPGRRKAAGRVQAGAAQDQPAQGQQQAGSLPGAGGGKPMNRGPGERLDQRPVRRWLVRLDPTDTVRQRGRQSAKRRYE